MSAPEEFSLLPFLGIGNASGDPNSTIPLTFRDRQVNDKKASIAYSNYQYNSHVAREMKANDRTEAPTQKSNNIFQPTGHRITTDVSKGKAPKTNFWFAGGSGLESRANEKDEQKTTNHMAMHQTLNAKVTTHGDYHMRTTGDGSMGGTRSLGGTTTMNVTRAGSDAWGTHTSDRLGQGMSTVSTNNSTYKGTIVNGLLTGPDTGIGPVGTSCDNQPHQILRLRQPPPSPQEVAARRLNQAPFPVPNSIINASTGAVSAVTESANYDGNPRWYASPNSDPRQIPFKRTPYAEHYVPIVANDGTLQQQQVHKDKNGFERGRGGVDQQWQQSRLDSQNVLGQVDAVVNQQKKDQQLKYREVLEEQMRIKQYKARQERHLENQLGFESVQPVLVVDRSGGASMGTVRGQGTDGHTSRQFDANMNGSVTGGTSTLVEFGPKNDYISSIDHVQRNKQKVYSRPPWVSDNKLNHQ